MDRLKILRGRLHGLDAEVVVVFKGEVFTAKQEAKLKAFIEKLMGKKGKK